MIENLKIKIIQDKFLNLDFISNFKNIEKYYLEKDNIDILVLPNLSTCGYFPFDLILKTDVLEKNNQIIDRILKLSNKLDKAVVFGTIIKEKDKLFNVIAFIFNNKIQYIYKNNFNNNSIKESAYFNHTDSNTNIIQFKNNNILITFKEDIDDIKIKTGDIHLGIVIDSSCFEILDSQINSINTRIEKLKDLSIKLKTKVIYLNNLGILDHLIFDGSSFVVDNGLLIYKMNSFEIMEMVIDSQNIYKEIETFNTNYENIVYRSIIFYIREFMQINKFKGLIIGLSGGIDSALSSVMAVDAMSAENVMLVSMPSLYTSSLSKKIAKNISSHLKIQLKEINIDNLANLYNKEFLDAKIPTKLSLENSQARIRGNLLMNMSNEFLGFVVVNNGNKTEVAVGYSTLYGDSCGAISFIQDLYKKQVYQIAKYRNTNIIDGVTNNLLDIIPKECIERKPSAELRENQFDEDSLIKYEILDNILEDFLDKKLSIQELYKIYNIEDVKKVINLIFNAEYKRKQGVLGIKISYSHFKENFVIPYNHNYKSLL
jgi:NAD+ synthase (glutamine-hydrolysing)